MLLADVFRLNLTTLQESNPPFIQGSGLCRISVTKLFSNLDNLILISSDLTAVSASERTKKEKKKEKKEEMI
jgi:hypothetical protein